MVHNKSAKLRNQMEIYGLMHPNTVVFAFFFTGMFFLYIVMMVVRFVAVRRCSELAKKIDEVRDRWIWNGIIKFITVAYAGFSF